MVEEYLIAQINEKYNEDKATIQKSIDDFETHIYEKYIHKYWYRIKSKKYLKRFLQDFKSWNLLPAYVEYSNMCQRDEMFSSSLQYAVRIGNSGLILNIPLVINITKLTKYLESQGKLQNTFKVNELSQIVVSDYWGDFEKASSIFLQQMDILYEERKDNPIILLDRSEVNNYVLLNGNHRVMNLYLNHMQEEVQGYVIDIRECIHFALTEDYVKLLDALLMLRKQVKGSMEL